METLLTASTPLLAAALALMGAAAPALAASSRPILLYDLSRLGSTDLNDPAACARAYDEAHLVACLQGIVNRKEPRLYLDAIRQGDLSLDGYWLEKLRAPGKWLAERRFEKVESLEDLLNRFRRDVRGLVVWDPRVPATSNVASTVAGCRDLLPVRYDPSPDSLYTRLTAGPEALPVREWLVNRDGSSLFTGSGQVPGTDRPSSGSAKADAYLWAIERYLKPGRCSNRHLGYYLDAAWLANPRPGGSFWNHTLTNHDYFVSRRAFFFDLSPWDDEPATDDPKQAVGTDLAVLKEVLGTVWRLNRGRRMCHIGGFVPWAFKYTKHAGGSHDDVPTEWRLSEIVSAHNAFVDADALGLSAMANASFYTHLPLKRRYPQPKPPTPEELRSRGYLTPSGAVVPKRYAAFYVGDYDSAAWLYQMLPRLWDHPDRGKVPLSWAFNPNLADRMAPALVYTRETASPLDRFVSGDSGAGYINPGLLEPPRVWSDLPSGSETWREHCLPYFRRWDLSVTGFVIDGYAPAMTKPVLDAYAAFSPGGIVAQKVPPLSLHGEMPVLRMDYDLTQTPPESARVLLSRLGGDLSGPPEAPTFHVFRAILKTPAWYRELMEAAHAAQPEAAVEFVDLPTLLALAKAHLKAELPRAEGRASRSGSGGTG